MSLVFVLCGKNSIVFPRCKIIPFNKENPKSRRLGVLKKQQWEIPRCQQFLINCVWLPISHYGINRNDWMGSSGLCPNVGGLELANRKLRHREKIVLRTEMRGGEYLSGI
jgi:hypothetical protein